MRTPDNTDNTKSSATRIVPKVMTSVPGYERCFWMDSNPFALQAHDPGSVVRYKNIRVKRL